MTNGHLLLRVVGAVVIVACAASPAPASAQSLTSRVNSASTPRVQFEFAAKPGVCGDGLSFLSSGNGSSYYGSINIVDGVATQPCSPGPVRVVVDRADGVITSIETVAGPLHPAGGATDLGTVTAREAVDFLMAIAMKTDGNAGRQAILPAGLADGVDIAPSLTAIARDQNRPIDIRRTALSWLARDDATYSEARTASAADLLVSIARDDNETQALRRTALSLLARVGHGAGVPTLMRLATDNASSWIGQESLRAISQSDDPRARAFLRKELANADLPEAMLIETIRALAGTQATGQDISLLRSTFASSSSERAREAILEIMAQRGTATDIQWLIGVARNASEPVAIRRRAIASLARTDDPRAKTALQEMTTR